MNKDRVIADTCIWIEYFRGSPGIKEELALLINEDSLVLCGIVVYELFQGIKNPKERDMIRSDFEAIPYLEMDRPIWELAAHLSLSLRNKGITVPPSDLILSALALENECMVYTEDAHFDEIPGISLYSPKASKMKKHPEKEA
jgi:tRNA(fMet)-specific endonuclease VapC